MASRSPRSLKHEYELFVEAEIENYKESVPRGALLKIGDEAAAALASQQQLVLTELLLCEEVDRIIFRRLGLPSYRTWRRRRLKALDGLRRPEHWGLSADDAIVRAVRPAPDGHVLVAGMRAEGQALYLAANGCAVTAIDGDLDVVQRVLDAAQAAGLLERVRGCVGDLASWTPDRTLSAVLCAPAAFTRLSVDEEIRVLAGLQNATARGGVHLLETELGGVGAVSIDELTRRYRGWDVSLEPDHDARSTFLARKAVSVME
jgi:hypothetical protein